jgi:hypothetical protein
MSDTPTPDIYLELNIDEASALFINISIGIEHYEAQAKSQTEILASEPTYCLDREFMDALALCNSMQKILEGIREELKEQLNELMKLQSKPVKPRWTASKSTDTSDTQDTGKPTS